MISNSHERAKMGIDNLTIGEAKSLAEMFSNQMRSPSASSEFFGETIGKYVIIRTYAAGVWAGVLQQKSKNEVVLGSARRMWQWNVAPHISLSAAALHGINDDKSRIAEPVEAVWLEAIEILPCTESAKKSIIEAKNAKAE